jgi:hypothetical protein
MTLATMNHGIDVRHVLRSIRVPTLVLHRKDDRAISVIHSRDIAQRVPNATYIELSGADHAPWVGQSDLVVDEIRAFAEREPRMANADQVLATVVFLDRDESNRAGRPARTENDAWRHVASECIMQHKGRELEAGDARIVAVFHAPVSAVRCAQALVNVIGDLRIPVRAGVHTAECDAWQDALDERVARVGAAVARNAEEGEVIITSAVQGLVAGSELRLQWRGERILDGVSGRCGLFAAT